MRKFVLYNSIGESYDLNSLQNFLYDPDGLGFKRDTDFMQIGSSFLPYKNDVVKQPEPKGTIRFKNPDAYRKFYDFARFLAKAPLRLEYTPLDTTFCLDCCVMELSKTEIGAGGLHCDIKFGAYGYYYQRESLLSSDDDTSGKVYSYTYPYTYSDVMPGMVVKEVDGSMESPVIITIYGPCVNPVWKHYLNNVLIATGRCELTLLTGHNLVIDTVSTPFSITEQDAYGNILFDRYQDSDFSTERFFLLKNGNNRIAVAHDGVMPPRLKVETRVLYETV